MGMLHAATLRMMPDISEVIIAETSPLIHRVIRTFAPDAHIVTDYREAFDDAAVQCAVIATPTASHAPIFQTLAPRLQSIFVEKPFAAGLADATSAISALPPKGSSAVMVGHCLRYSPIFVEAKRLIDAGVVGELTGFQATVFSSDVLKPARSWRFKGAAAGGGVLLDLGSHLVDMTRYFFGTPDRLTGRIRAIVSQDTEDAFESEWFYPNFSGKLEGSWSKPDCRKATLQIRVMGRQGQMTVTDDAVEVQIDSPAAGLPAGKTRLPITALEGPTAFELAGPLYTHQMEAWLRAVNGATLRANTLEENLINLDLIDHIRNSSGQSVRPAVTV